MQYYSQYLTSAAVAVGCVCLVYHVTRKKYKIREAEDALNLEIETVDTEKACDRVVKELRRRCRVHRALGFDCEWVTEHGTRNPVALVQLSSIDGLCGLFRLNCMTSFPTSLKELLEDETVYKVGVAAADDAKYLYSDYSVSLQSTLDIRHIAKLCGLETGGLAFLAKTLLGITLDKSWRVRCSNWEAAHLSPKQTSYAAADAHVAIKIFVQLFNRYNNKGLLAWLRRSDVSVADSVHQMCTPYANTNFKQNMFRKQDFVPKVKDPRCNKGTPVSQKPYPHATRSKPLYHNCFMQAPDGELLCTCDDKKAMWYVEKELADVVTESPLTVRLRFEPAGRCVGDVGRYYQLTKENKCVVCSGETSCIRKNVVPREYRKYFPEIMKDHSSHDVVLLCAECHRASNMRDQTLRERLAAECAAPLPRHEHTRTWENPVTKKIRSAARALLYQSQKHVLPESRRRELEDVLLQHYLQTENITQELLHDAANIQIVIENEDYESHGLRVTEYFKKSDGGLLKLEEMWRQHFLSTMKPKYMPDLWSTKHNQERLRVKWNEGRLSEEDLKQIGVTWT
ncbi:hypothetical protein O3G_MSEX010014 [Manduca sexta]|uniref:3'-5' exonuclease domain-containing protein n=1 Tax=Manduca sexta TaxID=7130 RepID=A0A922CSW1_MANSE|nr:hypothetical protein O3G_MSEX010014 [Manduca sexta]